MQKLAPFPLKMNPVISLVIGLILTLASTLSAQVTRVGSIAREFTVTDRATGKPIRMSDFAGKILVLDFFAYWCGPCQVSSPDLEINIQKYYAARGGNPYGVPVQVLAVSIEPDNSSLTDEFVREAGLELAADDPLTTAGAWSQFNEEGSIPLFAIINGVAQSPSHAQWLLMYKRAGYAGAATLRGYIDQVKKGAVIGPDIEVEQPINTKLTDGSTSISFGANNVGTASPVKTFTIRNTGATNLTSISISKNGTNAADFTIGAPSSTTIAPGASGTFTVSFNPSAIGSRTAAIHIVSNDTDESPFDITLTGNGVIILPEIAIEQPAGANLNDGTTAVTFANQDIGTTSYSKAFIIRNTGSADLTGLVMSRSGANASEFTVSALSTTTLAPGANTTFTATFTPMAEGYRSAVLQIASNDANENPFDITLGGTGAAPSAPEIVVEEPASNNLADGAAILAFGSSNIGTPVVKTITLRNSGTANLSGLSVSRSGTNASDFTVSELDSATLAPGGSTTFTVSFTPTALGFLVAALQITSNDADENPFDIVVNGSGAAAPEIVVEEPVDSILVDGMAALACGNSNIGTPVVKTITVRNTGSADLTGLVLSRSGANASDFSLSALGSTTLAPGANTSFTVTFTPAAAGSHTAELQISSNDPDENPFDITLTGTGLVQLTPEIVVEEPVGTSLVEGAAALAFGNSNIGTPVIKTVTICNTGTADLTGLAISHSGTNASDFTVSALGSTTLAPGANTSFTVTITPTAVGSLTAALQITSNDADENPLEITLSGIGVSVDPYDLTFVGTQYDLRVGNKVSFNLHNLITDGETVKVGGKIPSGLKYNATTGLLTGIISGKPGSYLVSIQVLMGKTVVRTIPLTITVLEFPPSLIGNFDLLMEDAGSVPCGVCKITITSANQWSATLESAGASKKRSAKGTFELAEGAPIAPIIALFPAIAATSFVPEVPSARVSISIDGSTPTITGTYDGGTLRGFRLAKVGEMPAATVAYSLVLDADKRDDTNIPAGYGWMKGKVSNKGIGTFKGLLGDGTAASITLGLSPYGQAVLWSQPYKNKSSYIGGIVTLGNLGQSTSIEELPTDEVWWTKTADAATLSYPSGFPGMGVTVGTSLWTAPASAIALGSSLGWRDSRKAEVAIDGGDLSNHEPQTTNASLPTEFTLDDKFALITSLPIVTTVPPSPPLVVWKGKVSKTDGAISGTLTLPLEFLEGFPSGTATASGVLVQDEQWNTLTGCGQIKVPAAGPKGSFKTAAIQLGQ